MVRNVVRLASLCAVLALWLLPASQTAQAQAEWLAALRQGGHVIIIRHGATHQDQADTDPLNLANIAKQRQLNDQGRELARSIGDSMRKLKIPVGQVITSMFNRAVETGTLLGFGADREQSSHPGHAQARRDGAASRHQRGRRQPQAQHHGRLWQGLVRRARGRGVGVQARRQRCLQAGRARAGERMGQARAITEIGARQPKILYFEFARSRLLK
jgi:hypothetical protein